MADTRINIISRAKDQVGPESYPFAMNSDFDAITREISVRYPLLNHNSASGNTVGAQNYLSLPTDYASWESLFVDGYARHWMEPEEWQVRTNSPTPSTGLPTRFSVVERDSKIYLWPTPDDVYAYVFYYAKMHPVSTGDSFQHSFPSEFDETLYLGMVQKILESFPDRLQESILWKDKFERDLRYKSRRYLRNYTGMRSNFWDSSWSIRRS